MINIISHRGYWLTRDEQNTNEAFQRALVNNFGIETDIRDYCGKTVISHDVPTVECQTFDSFMSLVSQYPPQIIALNVKSDGLQPMIKSGLGRYKEYFLFDMSIPDSVTYMKSGLNFYTRYSNYEKEPCLIYEAKGVWMDDFVSNNLDINMLDNFLLQRKKIVLVSPELHGFEYQVYWLELKQYLRNNTSDCCNISLCTDYPMEAREFFENENN